MLKADDNGFGYGLQSNPDLITGNRLHRVHSQTGGTGPDKKPANSIGDPKSSKHDLKIRTVLTGNSR